MTGRDQKKRDVISLPRTFSRWRVPAGDRELGIREAFSTDRVNVDAVKLLMDSYKSDKSDWERFANSHKY